MKKILSFGILTCLILLMIGCASNPRRIVGDCREIGKLANDLTISDCADIDGYKVK